MREIYADLHIHIGSSKNQPVKITASKKMTFENIMKESAFRKGLELVGIIDCASPLVLEEIQHLIDKGDLVPLKEGGLLYKDKTVVVLGSEIETLEENGTTPHFLCYFPHLDNIKGFSDYMNQFITNINLSSQNAKIPSSKLLQIVLQFEGVLIPAHAFTPFKSIYGATCKRLTEIMSAQDIEKIPSIELGLSADSFIADKIKELKNKTYLSNSDAHSLPKIAREYNVFYIDRPNFNEIVMAMSKQKGRSIKANYGLDPRLGKYHRTKCLKCGSVTQFDPPVTVCEKCGSREIVKGVLDRIYEIQDISKNSSPNYHYQIPLEFIPKVGPKTIDKLIKAFGSEMNILHKTKLEDLKEVVNEDIALKIVKARKGELKIFSGGGGWYGKVINV